MQVIYYQVTDQILLSTNEIYYGITLVPKKYRFFMFLKTKDVMKESQYSAKKVQFVDTLSQRTYLWDTAVPCGSENSYNVVQYSILV